MINKKKKTELTCHDRDITASAVTRIRTWVVSATTRSTNHYTITAFLSAAFHFSAHTNHTPAIVLRGNGPFHLPVTFAPATFVMT